MQYIHPLDRDSLRQMLGNEELPSGFEDEYRTQIRLLHRSGMTGPLGGPLLVRLCRDFDLEPPAPKSPENFDWANLESGTWILVGSKPARFKSHVGPGVISYTLPDDPIALESPVSKVKIHPEPPLGDGESN